MKIVLKKQGGARPKANPGSPYPWERHGHHWSELWCQGRVFDRRSRQWVEVHKPMRVEEVTVVSVPPYDKTYDLCRASCEWKYKEWGYGAAASSGGSPMAKSKEAKERRTSAADVLVKQFALERVKSDEDLISMVREATGSKKFDAKQLAWYKSQYRGGKLKGQDGKPGHLINQAGGHTKDGAKKAKAAKKVVVPNRREKKRRAEEPIEA